MSFSLPRWWWLPLEDWKPERWNHLKALHSYVWQLMLTVGIAGTEDGNTHMWLLIVAWASSKHGR